MYSQNNSSICLSLNISVGTKIKLINEPENLRCKFELHFSGVEFVSILDKHVDLIFLFVLSEAELTVELPILAKFINSSGKLVISIPNQSLGYVTDLSESQITKLAANASMIITDRVILDNSWHSFVLTHKKKDEL